MSRRIVLKGSVVAVVLGVVLVFLSCKKPIEDPKPKPKPEIPTIVGKWMYEKIELQELACSDSIAEYWIKMAFEEPTTINVYAESFGFVGMYEFTQDGKLIHPTVMGSEESSYELKDNKLTVANSENLSGTFDCFVFEKTMSWDVDLIEFAGEEAESFIAMGVTKCILRMTLTRVNLKVNY